MLRWICRFFDRLLRQPVSLQHRNGEPWDKDEIGAFGEKVAAQWLFLEGKTKVLWRNYRAPSGGEVDIVLRDGDVLVFVEVKTRTSLAFGRPADAVDAKKRQLIIRGARNWRSMLRKDLDVRFRYDIVEILLEKDHPPKVNWMQSAFLEE